MEFDSENMKKDEVLMYKDYLKENKIKHGREVESYKRQKKELSKLQATKRKKKKIDNIFNQLIKTTKRINALETDLKKSKEKKKMLRFEVNLFMTNIRRNVSKYNQDAFNFDENQQRLMMSSTQIPP
jgi:hypothetical protein